MGPIHDHCGSDGWIKVLDGELHELVYEVTEVPAKGPDQPATTTITQSAENVMKVEEVSCISGAGVHNLGNPSTDQIVVSLHGYSPP